MEVIKINAIKPLRLAKGLSQDELASIMGVSQSTITQWESGSKNPRFEKIPQLAEALGCTINDLFKAEDSDG